MTVDPFVALMRRYVVDYTNSHDLDVCDEIMEPDYVLRMGPHVVAGRDEAYKPATRRQLEQFPGLGLTVHEVVTNGERLALRFSEHGASVRHGGALAVWGGIGLYAWNGRRLTANRVEQDYLARRRQLAEGVPEAAPPPALAPWDTVAREPDPAVERAARAWAEAGVPAVGDVVLDDGRDPAPLVEADEVVVDDLFSAGDRAAVHVTVSGAFRGGLPGADEHVGAPATLHAAAIVTVAGDRVVAGHVIRDRLGLARALTPAGATR
ncbi:MAG TPA: ester cyclase [Actinomycetospora sp.]|nr:ester cyclase [Actinomycetospora sp.]